MNFIRVMQLSNKWLRNHNKKYKQKDLVNVNTGIILFYPPMTHKDQMDFLTLNHCHSWARSHLFSQSNCRLEFQEVAYYFFASRFLVFHFFYACLRYFDLMHQAFVYIISLSTGQWQQTGPVKKLWPESAACCQHNRFFKKK